MSQQSDVALAESLTEALGRVRQEIGTVVVGQKDVVEHLLVGLLAGGHCLLVGVPGLAKTLLVRSFAQVLDLSFNRVQFTPDLMPSDITGTEIIEEDAATGQKSFRFLPGPIFSNVLLADEINRTPPRTQSALLEAMQEHRVTAGGVTHLLPSPFYVLATENPIEQEGTYPLPEAQLDRFMFMLRVDYPSGEEEKQIVRLTTGTEHPPLESVLTGEQILAAQDLTRRVPADSDVIDAAVSLARRSRPGNEAPEFVKEWVAWGAGPRASQYLVLAAKALALLEGRLTPSVADVERLALPVLRHRIVTSFNAEAEGIGTPEIIARLVAEG